MKELSIVLVGEDREVGKVLDEIRKVKFVPIHLELISFAHLREALARIRPQLVIYNTNGKADSVKQTAAAISDEFSGIHWAVVSKERDVERVLQFFRMGAVDFLTEPIRSEDIRQLIQKIVDLERTSDSSSGDEMHRAIAVFSTKGGVGVTLTAVNLAVEMARNKLGKTVLLDLVLQHGNIADALDVPSNYILIDVIENFARLDSNLLEKSLATHPSGCYVLPCTKQPEDGELVVSSEISDIFQFLKGVFPFVIADMGHEFSKPTITFLDSADLILLLTTPEVLSLCNARNAMDTFRRLGYSPDKVKVVLNRSGMKGGLDPSIVQKSLTADIFFRLPDDPTTCSSSLNHGKSFYEVAKNSNLTKELQKLASTVVETVKKGAAHVAPRAS